jgi:hypothetical protein
MAKRTFQERAGTQRSGAGGAQGRWHVVVAVTCAVAMGWLWLRTMDTAGAVHGLLAGPILLARVIGPWGLTMFAVVWAIVYWYNSTHERRVSWLAVVAAMAVAMCLSLGWSMGGFVSAGVALLAGKAAEGRIHRSGGRAQGMGLVKLGSAVACAFVLLALLLGGLYMLALWGMSQSHGRG